MTLPRPIITILAHFEPLFTTPTWKKVVILLLGTILARGRRTVTGALRQMGRQMDPHFSGWVSSGAQPCALVTACREQEIVAGAGADLCACRRHGRDRHG